VTLPDQFREEADGRELTLPANILLSRFSTRASRAKGALKARLLEHRDTYVAFGQMAIRTRLNDPNWQAREAFLAATLANPFSGQVSQHHIHTVNKFVDELAEKMTRSPEVRAKYVQKIETFIRARMRGSLTAKLQPFEFAPAAPRKRKKAPAPGAAAPVPAPAPKAPPAPAPKGQRHSTKPPARAAAAEDEARRPAKRKAGHR